MAKTPKRESFKGINGTNYLLISGLIPGYLVCYGSVYTPVDIVLTFTRLQQITP